MHKLLFAIVIFGSAISQKVYSQNLRIGIIDSFAYQKYVSANYEKYYMDGFNLAKEHALNKGVNIEFQIFRYQYDELSIMEAIKKLKIWKPDVIIGPRDSKSFLTLGRYIKDTLSISPFATSLKVKSLPVNFHSMTYLDDYTAKIFVNFLQKELQAKSIYSLVELDCQSCKDLASEVERNFLGTFKKNYCNYSPL